MAWINLVIFLGVAGVFVYQRNKNKMLERELAALKEQQTAQNQSVTAQSEMLSSYKEMLDTQKALLTAYRDRLDGMVGRPIVPFQPLEQSAPSDPVRNEELERKQREILAEEKTKFEKEVQEKKKNMDWYEKEFTIGMSTLIELFLHIPRNKQEAIIARMPASVIKKGFKRLSDCLVTFAGE